MASNPYVNKVGLANGTTLIDLSTDTATQADVAQGKYFHLPTGERVQGTATGGGGSIYQDQDGYLVLSPDGDLPTIITKTITQNGTYDAEDDNADGYSSVTVNVSGGGGVTPAIPSDVNFFDYDGTIVYSYTAADFLALSALPSNPSHDGLVAQGWNWDLSNAQTYVGNYGLLNIGQMYTTDDGKTRIYITIEDGDNVNRYFYVRYKQSVSNGVTVDWGDGTVQAYSGTTTTNRSHQYSASGNYVITLSVTSGTMSFDSTSSACIYGNVSNAWNCTRIRKIEIGDNISNLDDYSFYDCYALETITLPSTVTYLLGQSFSGCRNLRSVTIPKNSVTGNASYTFWECFSLQSVIFSQSAVQLLQPFYHCYSLKYAIIPSGQTSDNIYSVADSNIEKLVIPNGVVSFYWNYVQNIPSLKSLTIGSSVTEIISEKTDNPALREIHMLPITPPTVSETMTVAGYMNLKVYVPYSADHSILDAYKAADKWSTIASYIVEEAQ